MVSGSIPEHGKRLFSRAALLDNKAPCSYMLCKMIVPLKHKNQAIGLWSNPDKMMIKWCPIIPIEQHGIYFGGTDAKLLKEMHDLQSRGYAIDSAMCYAELRIIVEKSPSETFIYEFCKTRDNSAKI